MISISDFKIVNDAWIWIVVVGFIIAFILAFGIGANDVANSFGSSVGAKILTLKQACILATVFEILGSVLIGAKVSDTIRKGIISVELFSNGTEAEFMVGNLAALSGSCIWMLVASFLKLPVSATHSIVGATLGFSLVAHGVLGVNWKQLGLIVGSWFASPLLSGGVSTILFFTIYKLVLVKDHPLEPGLRLLPLFYAATVAINLFSVFYKGSELLHFNEIPLYGTFILTFGSAIIAAVLVRVVVVPWQRKKIQIHCQRLIKQKEEEFLIESDKNYQNTLNAQSKEAAELFQHLNEKDKEKLDDLPSKPCSISAKKLPFGILDSNVDDTADLAAYNKSNASGSVSVAFSTVPLLKPLTKHKDKFTDHMPSIVVTIPKKELAVIGDESPGHYMGSNSSGNMSASSASLESETSLNEMEKRELARNKVKDVPETTSLFSFLQILTAVFGAFAHGGNDVSNAIGPLVALWVTATTGSAAQKVPVPIWILLLGGLGISIGLWVLGKKVMKTLGEDLTKITPSSGFCIEVGSALTVLLASNIGIPVSTTHCKVGSIVFIGWFRSREGVDWRLFRNIVIAWFVTLPIAGGLSAAFMAGLRELI